jgi:hypothetical protein
LIKRADSKGENLCAGECRFAEPTGKVRLRARAPAFGLRGLRAEPVILSFLADAFGHGFFSGFIR